MSDQAIKLCESKFKKIEEIAEVNSQKVLSAFIKSKISESHFVPTTGYGYNDRGREKLDELFARIFGTEDAIVRQGFASGTHTLSTALFGILRPGDKILSVTGTPYDTMLEVIGENSLNLGSLSNFGIHFDYLNHDFNSNDYFENLKEKLKDNFKAVYIQRSRGYSLRSSLSSEEIGKIISFVKSINPNIISVVDNCYGEFVEINEPSNYGADLVIGSLIKNPGGGIALSGGYIAGKSNLIDLCSHRFTAPGIGREIGANLIGNRDLFMGVYNAPKTVAEALKTAVFASAAFELLGYEVYPRFSDERYDIVQSIVLKNAKKLVLFCKGIQQGSPIDSFVSPEPWDMPGYDSKVVMAAGNFVSGSSIELSADGPLREPYAVWLQGGTCFYTAKIGVMQAMQFIVEQQ